jgi:NADPH-dependent 2,4-dienoyl-CoA reductase/sulfur reductase-like enzyme
LLVGPGPLVDRPPLTKAALAKREPRLLATGETLAGLGVGRLDALAEVDLATRTVRAGEQEIVADHLVLATGLAYPRLDGTYLNCTPQGFAELAPELASPRAVTIVGAGLIGCETAATLAAAGHRVTLLDLLDRPLARLHDPFPAIAEATLAELGVRFIGGGAGELSGLVISAVGGRGEPIAVDGQMRVPGHDEVYAIGDLAHPWHARFGRLTFPHWEGAFGTGEQAADAILGTAGPDYDRLPYWWCDLGPRQLGELGDAGSVADWRVEDGLHVGRDAAGEVACVLVVDEPRRLREARAMLLAAA